MKEKTVYALGFFDGVHLGHQALLQACKSLAEAHGCKAAAVTFSTHPDTLVLGKTPGLINTIEDRVRLLKAFGMDDVVVLPFDKRMQTMPWQDFLEMLRINQNAAGLVCGYDFRFGNRGAGNARSLGAYCRENGMVWEVVPEQTLDDIAVSSTHIRNLLEEGKMEAAAKFLGHPHILSGEVISGRRLGRNLGIPTANLALPEGVLTLPLGVYACRVRIGEQSYMAVTNIGFRPTVGGHHVTVEPWILDFDADLYGRHITLELHSFLRPEKSFASLPELKAEIQKNACQTREYFEKVKKN